MAVLDYKGPNPSISPNVVASAVGFTALAVTLGVLLIAGSFIGGTVLRFVTDGYTTHGAGDLFVYGVGIVLIPVEPALLGGLVVLAILFPIKAGTTWRVWVRAIVLAAVVLSALAFCLAYFILST